MLSLICLYNVHIATVKVIGDISPKFLYLTSTENVKVDHLYLCKDNYYEYNLYPTLKAALFCYSSIKLKNHLIDLPTYLDKFGHFRIYHRTGLYVGLHNASNATHIEHIV